MRDNFGLLFSNSQPEDKQMNFAAENKSLNGIHVSSNVYYGYQPLARDWPKETTFESMDIQITNRSGIDFNGTNIEERLCCEIVRQRKRPFGDDVLPTTIFKKRRENEFCQLQTPNKCLNLRQPTHNVPDVPRTLMDNKLSLKVRTLQEVADTSLVEHFLWETHGCTLYHWKT